MNALRVHLKTQLLVVSTFPLTDVHEPTGLTYEQLSALVYKVMALPEVQAVA